MYSIYLYIHPLYTIYNIYIIYIYTDLISFSLKPIITLTNVMGELIFDGNQGQGRDGGAVYITDHSQINLHRGSQLRFMDNVGR